MDNFTATWKSILWTQTLHPTPPDLPEVIIYLSISFKNMQKSLKGAYERHIVILSFNDLDENIYKCSKTCLTQAAQRIICLFQDFYIVHLLCTAGIMYQLCNPAI